jgi:hypothetical protein
MSVVFALALAYAGMLALCFGLERHYKHVWRQLPSPRRRRALRIGGWLALAASLLVSATAWGWAMGPVGWLGLISLAGLGLVFLLPYWPRFATALAALATPGSLLAWLL